MLLPSRASVAPQELVAPRGRPVRPVGRYLDLDPVRLRRVPRVVVHPETHLRGDRPRRDRAAGCPVKPGRVARGRRLEVSQPRSAVSPASSRKNCPGRPQPVPRRSRGVGLRPPSRREGRPVEALVYQVRHRVHPVTHLQLERAFRTALVRVHAHGERHRRPARRSFSQADPEVRGNARSAAPHWYTREGRRSVENRDTLCRCIKFRPHSRRGKVARIVQNHGNYSLLPRIQVAVAVPAPRPQAVVGEDRRRDRQRWGARSRVAHVQIVHEPPQAVRIIVRGEPEPYVNRTRIGRKVVVPGDPATRRPRTLRAQVRVGGPVGRDLHRAEIVAALRRVPLPEPQVVAVARGTEDDPARCQVGRHARPVVPRAGGRVAQARLPRPAPRTRLAVVPVPDRRPATARRPDPRPALDRVRTVQIDTLVGPEGVIVP